MSAESNISASLGDSLRSIATSILFDPEDRMFDSLDGLTTGTAEEKLAKVSNITEYLAAQLYAQETARSSLREEQEGTAKSLLSAVAWPLGLYGAYQCASAVRTLYQLSGIGKSSREEKSEAA